MGTWAAGSFESDDALEWLERLYKTKDFALVRNALTADFQHAEPYIAIRAVAAADLVACSLGQAPPEPKRRGLVDWAQQHSNAFTPELTQLARNAVAVIKCKSKLRDAWTAPDGSVDSQWLASISDLEERLQ